MAEETTTLPNIDIKDFGTTQAVADSDYVVLSLANGTSAKVFVSLLKAVLTSHISPNIVEGTWYVGSTSTGVTAEGQTPQMRRGSLGIEYKYTTEDDTAWRLLVSYTDIKLQFDSLSDAQKEEIFDGMYTQMESEILEPVNTAIASAESASQQAITASNEARTAAAAANQYANRVVDLTEEQWEALEESGTWIEGVEYNVYEV